jgi:anti-sigma-K factor RskA
VATYDDDKDAFAAEYVLGTLSASEREQAEAMLAIDPNFEAAVRQWERRLGELNVMVEAVEPAPQVWDKIKLDMHAASTAGAGRGVAEVTLSPDEMAPHLPAAPELEAPAALSSSDEAPAHEPETVSPGEHEAAETGEGEQAELSPLAALEASLFHNDGAAAEAGAEGAAPTPRVEPRGIERNTDTVLLVRRAARWRRMTALVTAIAAVLAAYVAVSRVAPDLLPAPLRPGSAKLVERAPAPPTQLQRDRLVAVLQQDPVAPAFLVTLDTRSHALTVRRVRATPETGRTYQLWLIAKGSANPRSLGIVGESEFTQRALPANYDVETLLAATYAISLEPAGGSPSGRPTGPVLFTGAAVESLPSTAPAAAPPT